jgi:hypothetical protein
MKFLTQDIGLLFPDRDLNPRSPEYESGVPTTRPRCSVVLSYETHINTLTFMELETARLALKENK